MTTSPRLLTPIQDEEVYPYRRVWVSIALENSILFTIAAAFFVAGLFSIAAPRPLYLPINGLILIAPLVLWGLFSLARERVVLAPRTRLVAVLVVAALAANALAIPVIDEIFQPARWLPLASAVTRIVGYTVTVGVFQEVLKYLVIRYIAYPDGFRTRLDSVAYAAACAIGYALVFNLQFLRANPTDPAAFAVQVFNTLAGHLAASLIVAYGMAEIRFGRPTPLLMPLTVTLAALINGGIIPLRAGLVNASFSLDGGFTSPLFGFALSALVLLVVTLIMAFLFTRADREAREVVRRE